MGCSLWGHAFSLKTIGWAKFEAALLLQFNIVVVNLIIDGLANIFFKMVKFAVVFYDL